MVTLMMGHQYFQGWPPSRAQFKEVSDGKPVTSVRQLIDRIDKYKRVEED